MKKKPNIVFYLHAEHEDIIIVCKMEVMSSTAQIFAVVFSKYLNTEAPTQTCMALIHPRFIYVLILFLYD